MKPYHVILKSWTRTIEFRQLQSTSSDLLGSDHIARRCSWTSSGSSQESASIRRREFEKLQPRRPSKILETKASQLRDPE